MGLPVDLDRSEGSALYLPGTALIGAHGENCQGAATNNIGPVSAEHQDIARLIEREDTAHGAVIRVETKGPSREGGTSATGCPAESRSDPDSTSEYAVFFRQFCSSFTL